jgi:hypothetical protein
MRRAQSGTADIAGSAGNADNDDSVIGGESLTSKQLADGSSGRAKSCQAVPPLSALPALSAVSSLPQPPATIWTISIASPSFTAVI